MSDGDLRRADRVGVRRELTLIYGVAAVALIVVSIGALLASRSVARAQALRDAERMTVRLADLVVGPNLEGALNGDAEQRAELDRDIANRMADGYLTEITVWDKDGMVLYSDEADEIGEQVETPPEVTAAIARDEISSAFEDSPEAAAEARANGGAGYVEVYVPFDVPGQEQLAFEAYYDYARVDETATTLFWYLIPLVLVPLVVLQCIQVPIVGSLARRVRRHEAEQSRLLELTVSVSERERIRIAADLHDGPIQDLAGAGYALESIEPSVPQRQAPLLQAIQDTVRRAIESLRWLMVDLYPPDLSASQLPGTIARLAEPLRQGGIDVHLTAEPLPDALSEDVLTTLYRVARETLANVSEHALADQVQIDLGVGGTSGPDDQQTVHLVIVDNGIGLDPEDFDRRAEGHLGLRLLKDRVENSGGTWSVTAGPDGGGTAVSAVLPLTGRADRRTARAPDSGPTARPPSGAPTSRR